MFRQLVKVLSLLALAGCAVPETGTAPTPEKVVLPPGVLPPDVAARNFVTVVDRVGPVAEQLCNQVRHDGRCNFRIFVDNDPQQPPNAFQVEDRHGQPVIVLTIALVATVKNADELAFIVGHETAHQIAGHIDLSNKLAMEGAVLAGAYAKLGGAGAEEVKKAQQIGAEVNSRRYSKEFELEADALGTRIAYAAGFDPLRGAEYFQRIADPGDEFLGTHPPNSQRVAVVKRTMAEIRAGH